MSLATPRHGSEDGDDGLSPGADAAAAVNGRAAARRAASAGMADLAERRADGVAALDRALEARLGEFDRAFATRRAQLDSRLGDAETGLLEVIANGVSEFKRAGSDERRLLHEQAAAHLDELQVQVREHVRELQAHVAEQLASLRALQEDVVELDRAVEARRRELGGSPG